MLSAKGFIVVRSALCLCLQYAAEVAYDMVSPGPSVRHKRHFQRQRRAAQPADIREGVTNAYQVVKEVSGACLVLPVLALFTLCWLIVA